MQGKVGKVGRVNLPGNVGKMREFLDNTLNTRSKDYFYIVQHSIVIVLRSLRYCVLSLRFCVLSLPKKCSLFEELPLEVITLPTIRGWRHIMVGFFAW